MIDRMLKKEILNEGLGSIFNTVLNDISKTLDNSIYYHNQYINDSNEKELDKYCNFLEDFKEDELKHFNLDELFSRDDIKIKKFNCSDKNRILETIKKFLNISLIDLYYDDEVRGIEFNNWFDLETKDMGWLWNNGEDIDINDKLLNSLSYKLGIEEYNLNRDFIYLIESNKYFEYGNDKIQLYHIIRINKEKNMRVDYNIVGTTYYVNMF